MNKKQVSKLHKAFAGMAAKLGAKGDGETREPIGEPDKRGYFKDHSYGYYCDTKYGVLTFRLEAEAGRGETVNVYGKFLDPEKFGPGYPSYSAKCMQDFNVNGIGANCYTGKWNWHLGEIDVDRAITLIGDMLDPAGLQESNELVA